MGSDDCLVYTWVKGAAALARASVEFFWFLVSTWISMDLPKKRRQLALGY